MLDNISKKNPFNVPENYFKTLKANILSNLPLEEVKETKKNSLLRRKQSIRWGISIAAVLLGCILYLGVKTANNKDLTTQINSTIATNNVENNTNLNNEYYSFIEEEVSELAYQDEIFQDF